MKHHLRRTRQLVQISCGLSFLAFLVGVVAGISGGSHSAVLLWGPSLLCVVVSVVLQAANRESFAALNSSSENS